MFRKLEDFYGIWENNIAQTSAVFKALTDASLQQSVADGHRNLGRIAWHIVLSIAEMCNRIGLVIDGPEENAPVPASVNELVTWYERAGKSLIEDLKKQWTDETLGKTDNMYGREWPRGLTLFILLTHEIHHRAQMTVLMRQAGLRVPGVFGPAKEDWIAYKQEPPEV